MSLLETLQYENELCDMGRRSKGVVLYGENPEGLKKAVDEVKQFRYTVTMSKIKDCDKNPIVKCADRLLESLGYKPDNQDASIQPANHVKEKGDSILSYIIPLGLMLIPMILDEIFPKKYENDDEKANGGQSAYLNMPGDNKSD